MSEISYNSMIMLLIDRSERGESSTIGFHKATGEGKGNYTEKKVLYGAPRKHQSKTRASSSLTKQGENKKLIKQGKLALTEVSTEVLITPFSRLVVFFEGKKVKH
jgi:hypothetical protein